MLFKQHILNEIAAGRITCAYRRWKRPTVKSGGTLNTPIGLLGIRSVAVVAEAHITPESANRAGYENVEQLLDSLAERDGELYLIQFERIGDDPRISLRQKSTLTPAEFQELQSRLQRLDRSSKQGPWTGKVLQLIAKNPERRAAELADRSQFEKEWLKTNIRKLKNLGLTESLDVGYRLSPRGSAYLKHLQADSER